MNILIIAATSKEIEPFMLHLGKGAQKTAENRFQLGHHHISILITGVGMMETAYNLTKNINKQETDLALQLGIAGSYDRELQPGEVVFIKEEKLGDLGAEDHYNFLDVYDLGLADSDKPPFARGRLLNNSFTTSLKAVSSLSVNKTTGTAFTAEERIKKYGCQLENMEGAAFHYVCLKENIPFAQVRSISNYAEARDKTKWQIKEAVINLNNWLIDFLNNLS
jgi:futalosine hydrolase